MDGDFVARVPVGQQAIGASIHGLVSNNFVTRSHRNAEGSRDSGHPCRKSYRDFSTFRVGQTLLQHPAGGFVQAVIYVDWDLLPLLGFQGPEIQKSLGAAMS